MPAGDCHVPVPGISYWYWYHNRNSKLAASYSYFVFYTKSELLVYTNVHTACQLFLGGCRSWWLPIKLPCTHYPTPQAHNHVELKQNISISVADVGGSRSSCAVAADDLGSGQQGGSSADPGVALFLPHMYVLPCVSCTGIKLALAHTFTFARVHPACSSSCFTHVCQGGI